jgi:hypothetical protein
MEAMTIVIARYILTFLALGVAILVVTAAVTQWRKLRQTSGWKDTSFLSKWIAVARGSATWLLGCVQIVGAAIIDNLESIASALGQPHIADILEKHFEPKLVGSVLLVSGLFILWARSRTLGKANGG